jgi:hypothetical protein
MGRDIVEKARQNSLPLETRPRVLEAIHLLG